MKNLQLRSADSQTTYKENIVYMGPDRKQFIFEFVFLSFDEKV